MIRHLSSLAFAVLCTASCSNGGTGADGGTDASPTDSSPTDSSTDGSSAATKACNDEATAVCALRDSCSPGYNVTVTYGSDSACQSRTAQVCINALGAKGTGNNATLIEACAGAYPSEACTDFFDGNPVTACVPPAGTLTTGSACGASAQCASTYCAVGPTAVCGTCQPLPTVGASCQVEADCGRDLVCAIPTVAGDAGLPAPKCAAWVTSGNPCLTGYEPCQSGFSCVGDDEATMTKGTCQASGATVGTACDGTRKTMASCQVDIGLVCIPTAKGSAIGTCQKITLVGPNAACGDIGSAPITGFAVCQSSGLCKKAALTDPTGACVDSAAEGSPCDNNPLVGPPCLTPAKCVVSGSGTAGTCTLPNASTCM
jgi:hypothetical protein